MLSAFLAAFVTVAIYKVCVKNNVTIRMPDEVPPNISQVFKDVIPFTLSVVSLYGLDLLARQFVGASVAESIGNSLRLYSQQQTVMLVLRLFSVPLHSSGLLVFTAHLSLSLRLQRSLMQMLKST